MIGRGEKVVRRKQQMCIIFRHGSFENVELYAVERYCSITKEGPESEFFTDEIDEMIEETFVEDAMLTEETKEDEESEKIDAHRHGGELELLDLAMAGFVVEMVVILDSGFCVLRALIELKKRGVFASALIKKRRYWPKHIKGDDIIKHFEKHKVGDTESLPGTLDGVPFHVFAMKEPDYTMKIMSTYGTNERNENHRTRRVYKDENNKLVSTLFNYPEVISNHFKFRHAVDDHNGRRHSPICLEHVWATKY